MKDIPNLLKNKLKFNKKRFIAFLKAKLKN